MGDAPWFVFTDEIDFWDLEEKPGTDPREDREDRK